MNDWIQQSFASPPNIIFLRYSLLNLENRDRYYLVIVKLYYYQSCCWISISPLFPLLMNNLFLIHRNNILVFFFFLTLISQGIKDSLGRLMGPIDIIHSKKVPALQSATPREAANIQEKLTQLNLQWEKVNKMYRDRQM